jgi:hypothetical protein
MIHSIKTKAKTIHELAFFAQSSGNNEVVMAAAGIFEPQFECHGHVPP